MPDKGAPPLSPNDRECIDAVSRSLAARRTVQAQRRSDVKTFMTGRNKESRAITERLLAECTASIKTNMDTFAASECGEESVKLFLESQLRRALEAAPAVSGRHEVAVAERLGRLNEITQLGGSAPVVAVLPSALAIQVNWTGGKGPGAYSTDIRPQHNLAQVQLQTDAYGSLITAEEDDNKFTVDWYFKWQVPRYGLLNAVSVVLFNGFWSVNTDSSWIERSLAAAGFDIALSITQGTTGIDWLMDTATADGFGVSVQSGPVDLLGAVNSGPYDEERVLAYNNNFLARPQAIYVVLSISFFGWVRNGHALLDFSSSQGRGDFGVNVPFVALFPS